MKFPTKQRAWLALACVACVTTAVPVTPAHAEPGRLTVRVDQPGVKISPTFNGLMIEEINHSFDGGLYAELIQNRDFKDDAARPAHWSVVQDGGGTGTITLDNSQPVPGTALTTSLRLDITGAGTRVGVANDGYWGIPVKPGTAYRASLYAKGSAGLTGPLTLSIESADGATVYAKSQVSGIGADWKQYTATLTTDAAASQTANARFVISASAPGTVWLTQVSLMPPTFNNRPNGLRPDLMQKLGAMHPMFLRMPGGNYLEGNTIADRFQWKKTIGPIAQRPGHNGTWGYRSSDGMGLLELLEWCEDLHMQPVLAVWAGFALNRDHIVAGPELTPYVQDALDEIEYVTGDKNTVWGARRIADGHPAPFPLTYVEIGNEDFFDGSGSYDGRYAQFYDAIKAKYPNLQIIATRGDVKGHKMDVYDDHYYRSARDMANDARHYDTYDRSGPKVFVGEWASTEGSPTPNLQAALGDAAWLTGMERNSDLIVLESYAPLLVNVNNGARQWGTNLIGYDALSSFGSPSYYVQSMFGKDRGDVVLPVDVSLTANAPTALPLPHGKIGVGTWDTHVEYKDISVTQNGKTLYTKDFTAGLTDWTLGQGQWQAQDGVLRQSGDGTDYRATAGDAGWGDYTYSLKARKLAGKEGFLIIFHYADNDHFLWWNVGGWVNSRTAIQRFDGGPGAEISRSAPVTVETGRWYDIKIELKGDHIRCYLDGKLVNEATDAPPPPSGPIFAAASRDLKTGDIILKAVNVSDTAYPLQVDLQGANGVAATAVAEVLAGEPGDVNSVETPEKVAPKTITLTGTGRTFLHEFPAHSVTVLRVKARR